MTTRKKKGIGFGVSGVAFLLLAVFNIWFEVTPDWVSVVLDIVAAIAGILGFRFVYPDKE